MRWKKQELEGGWKAYQRADVRRDNAISHAWRYPVLQSPTFLYQAAKTAYHNK